MSTPASTILAAVTQAAPAAAPAPMGTTTPEARAEVDALTPGSAPTQPVGEQTAAKPAGDSSTSVEKSTDGKPEEKPAEKPPEEKKPEDRMSRGFAKLAREQAALRDERKAFEAEKKAAADITEARKLARTDPLKAVQLLLGTEDVEGFYSDLTLAQLGQQREPTEEERVQKLVDARIEAERKAREEAEEKSQQEQLAARAVEVKGLLGKHIAAQSAAYPLLSVEVETEPGTVDEIYDGLMELQRKGEAPDLDAALKRVEEHLAHKETLRQQKRAKPAPAAPPQVPERQTTASPPGQSGPTTLSTRSATEVPVSLPGRRMSREESIAQAAKLIEIRD